MIRRTSLASILLLLASILTACGGSEPLNPEAIGVELTTETPAVANEETKLVAKLTGGEFPEATNIQFDIRVDLIPRLINGQAEGDDVYTAQFTFPEAGYYDVYMHIFVEDLHLTKLAQVEVQ